jgi:hypothetical protein
MDTSKIDSNEFGTILFAQKANGEGLGHNLVNKLWIG